MARTISNVFTLTVVPGLSLPARVTAIPEGSFANVSDNTLASVDPCPSNGCVYSPAEGQNAIFDWCSGTRIKGVGRFGLLAHWGGGHNGYYGNEVYTFDFETFLWERRKNPGLYGPQDDGMNVAYADPSTNNPLTGYRVHSYIPGTFTPRPVYADEACTIEHPNPLIVDSNGRVPEVWTPPGVRYRWMVVPPGDTNPPSNPFPRYGATDNRMINRWLEYDPGEVVACHTYRQMMGLSPALSGNALGMLVQVGFSAAGKTGVFGCNGAQAFSFGQGTSGTWGRYSASIPSTPTTYGPVALDEVHGKFYSSGSAQASWQDAILVLDCVTRQYTQVVVNQPLDQFPAGAYTMMDYCPTLDCLVVIRIGGGPGSTASPTNPEVWTADAAAIRAGTNISWVQRTTNAFSGSLGQGHSINWANFMSKFVMYNGGGSNAVYYLQPPATIGGTWLWSTELFAGFNGATPATSDPVRDQGFARFQPIDEFRCFSWYSGRSSPVQLWKPR